jgi:hypothetical protein
LTYKADIVYFPIGRFLEQHVSYVEIGMIQNINAKLGPIRLVGLQNSAQVVRLESLKTRNVLLETFPFINGLGECLQTQTKQHVRRRFIAINVVIEVRKVEFLKQIQEWKKQQV